MIFSAFPLLCMWKIENIELKSQNTLDVWYNNYIDETNIVRILCSVNNNDGINDGVDINFWIRM